MKQKNSNCYYCKHSSKNPIFRVKVAAITTFVLLNCTNITSYATTTAGTVLNKANALSALQTLYSFILTISVPVAAVGMAMCAFSFFIPGEKGWETAKKRILHIGVALAALFLIPAVMGFATHSPAGSGWKAEGGNTQMIPNQSAVFDIKDGPSGDDP